MTPPQATPQRSRWLILTLVSQIALGMLALAICLPSMQQWVGTFGASQASVQLTFSAYGAAFGVLQLVHGPLSDRLGRKPILLLGLVLSLLGSLMAGFAESLSTLIAARVLQGAGTAACMVVGRALVQDFYRPEERTRVMAFIGMTMGLVPSVATVLGGQIHVHLGWRANFFMLAGLSALLLVAVWKGIPARPPAGQARGLRDMLAGYARLLREPGFPLYVAILSTTTGAFYIFLAGAPLVLASHGVTPEMFGWYMMAIPTAYVVGNLLTTRLTRRRGDRFLMTLGQGFNITGLLLTLGLALAGVHGPVAALLPLAILGIGHGLLAPPTLSGTVGLLPALAGSAAAVAGLMQQLGGAVGGYVVGLVPHHGSVNMVLLMILFTLAGVAAQALLFRVRQRQRGG